MQGSMTEHYDVLVIGAGIAGASLAASLPAGLKVVLLEQEDQPGYHATGRSAALFSEAYGPGPVRALTRASRDFFFAPPEDFGPHPLMTPRGVLYVGTQTQLPALQALAAKPGIAEATRLVDPVQAGTLSPLLAQGYAAGGLHEDGARDIDVHALHTGFLRRVKAAGGRLVTEARVEALERGDGLWQARTARGVFAAPIVVNAAGAWADQVAMIAGLSPKGLQPHRRTAMIVAAPEIEGLADSAMVIDVDEQFYWKPDAGRLLLSLADETAMDPCDVQPDEMDIAIAVDRIEQATTLRVRRIERSWAGLRTFVADRTPMIGFDVAAEGFFWLAGQGGYGIQSAPAAGRLAAGLLTRADIPADLVRHGVVAADFSPSRLPA
jgi:D-arginine dehydrogenase